MWPLVDGYLAVSEGTNEFQLGNRVAIKTPRQWVLFCHLYQPSCACEISPRSGSMSLVFEGCIVQLHPLQGNSGQLQKPKAFSKCQEASPHQAVSHHRYTFRAKITKPCRSVVSSGLRICALVKQLMGKILGTSSCSKNYMHKFGNKKTPSATTLAVKHIPSPIKVLSRTNIFSPSHLLTRSLPRLRRSRHGGRGWPN